MTYSGVEGWQYMRAGIPVFVTVAEGATGAYVFAFRNGLWPDDPPPPQGPYAIACGFSER